MIVRRVVTTQVAVEKVFDYLSDFTTTTQWDPGTVRTVLVRGGGGVGTEYRNTSRLAGRTTELTYVVTRLQAPDLIVLRGQNGAVVAEDTIVVERIPGGTQVTYTAEFTFAGVWKLVAPLLGPAFRRLGDEAEVGMRAALAEL